MALENTDSALHIQFSTVVQLSAVSSASSFIAEQKRKYKAFDPVQAQQLLTPARRIITNIEAERVMSAVEEAISRVEIVTLLRFMTENVDRFRVSLGAQLVRLLKRHSAVISSYDDIYACLARLQKREARQTEKNQPRLHEAHEDLDESQQPLEKTKQPLEKTQQPLEETQQPQEEIQHRVGRGEKSSSTEKTLDAVYEGTLLARREDVPEVVVWLVADDNNDNDDDDGKSLVIGPPGDDSSTPERGEGSAARGEGRTGDGAADADADAEQTAQREASGTIPENTGRREARMSHEERESRAPDRSGSGSRSRSRSETEAGFAEDEGQERGSGGSQDSPETGHEDEHVDVEGDGGGGGGGGSSGDSPKSTGSFEEMPALNEVKFETMMSAAARNLGLVALQLSHSTRNVLRACRGNLAVTSLLKSHAAVRNRSCKDLLSYLNDLREVLLYKLLSTPQEERDRVETIEKFQRREERRVLLEQKLEANLQQMRQQKDEQNHKSDAFIVTLQNELRQLIKTSQDKVSHIRLEAAKQEAFEERNSDARRQKLLLQIAELHAQHENALAKNRESEALLRKKKFKVEAEVCSWISRYDDTLGAILTEFEEVAEVYNGEKQKLLNLQARFRVLEEEYDVIMAVQQEARERRLVEERELDGRVQAAKLVQASWRAKRVRKLLAIRDMKKRGKRRRNKKASSKIVAGVFANK